MQWEANKVLGPREIGVAPRLANYFLDFLGMER